MLFLVEPELVLSVTSYSEMRLRIDDHHLHLSQLCVFFLSFVVSGPKAQSLLIMSVSVCFRKDF